MDLIDLAIRRDLPGVRHALAGGCPVDSADEQGFTALHVAAQEYAIDVMHELVSAGADVNAQSVHGNGPLWVAVFNSQGRGEAIELLLNNGADPDMLNRAGRSPRQLAETIANHDVAQFFWDA